MHSFHEPVADDNRESLGVFSNFVENILLCTSILNVMTNYKPGIHTCFNADMF